MNQNTASFSENVTDESNLEDFEDLMVAIRQFQSVYRDSETIEGAFLADSVGGDFPASQKILCTVWCCVYMHVFISE